MTTRILVVDDHVLTRGMLLALLAGESGLEVVGQAGDGLEAVRRAAELAPDIVLMDVVLPELNGIEATRRILAANLDVRVIGLSMCTERAFIDGLFEAGASGYLLKDTDLGGLADTVRAVAGGRAVAAGQRASNPGKSISD